MKYCRYCGKEMLDEASICINCGCAVHTNNIHATEVDETINAGLVVLAVLVPLFGIIYWITANKTHPKCARTCGIASLVSWAVYFSIITAMLGM